MEKKLIINVVKDEELDEIIDAFMRELGENDIEYFMTDHEEYLDNKLYQSIN